MRPGSTTNYLASLTNRSRITRHQYNQWSMSRSNSFISSVVTYDFSSFVLELSVLYLLCMGISCMSFSLDCFSRVFYIDDHWYISYGWINVLFNSQPEDRKTKQCSLWLWTMFSRQNVSCDSCPSTFSAKTHRDVTYSILTYPTTICWNFFLEYTQSPNSKGSCVAETSNYSGILYGFSLENIKVPSV